MTRLQTLLDTLARIRVITPADVIALRQAVFGGDAIVSMAEAQMLIELDDATVTRAPEWRAFYTEALTDYLVRQQPPIGYVDEVGAAWLIGALQRDGAVRAESELELLVHILEQADEVPASLSDFALRQVKAKVLEDGVISADEVALIRRALYAPASPGNIAITRAEAEILFDINDACRGADNDAGWSDLFSKALVASVMTVSGYGGMPRQEALRRQIWLETPESLGGFFDRMTHGVGAVWRDPIGAMRNDDEDAIAADNQADAAAYSAAERIEADEAQWLADRMRRDGIFDEGERRVVDFLRHRAPTIHPSFKPVLDASPAPQTPKPFGRRGAA